MKKFNFIIFKEGKYYVSQCLNIDISSFGISIEEAKHNLQEAIQLYFEGNTNYSEYLSISETLIGETQLQVK